MIESALAVVATGLAGAAISITVVEGAKRRWQEKRLDAVSNVNDDLFRKLTAAESRLKHEAEQCHTCGGLFVKRRLRRVEYSHLTSRALVETVVHHYCAEHAPEYDRAEARKNGEWALWRNSDDNGTPVLIRLSTEPPRGDIGKDFAKHEVVVKAGEARGWCRTCRQHVNVTKGQHG